MVVDINCLQSQELRDFLASSINNLAVLPDCAAMEMHNGRLDTALRDNVSVLSKYPTQVLVLKPTRTICGLRGRPAGLVRRLIDDSQTRDFPKFCESVTRFAAGDEGYRPEILRLREQARNLLSGLAEDLAERAADYAQVEKELFTPSEVRAIRLREPMGRNAAQRYFDMIAGIAELMHREHPQTKREPSREEWPNTFLYRFALFHGLHFLNWIRKGSPSNLNADKIRNDAMDLAYGAYATYFDGLMTKDQRSLEVYEEASYLLTTYLLPASRPDIGKAT